MANENADGYLTTHVLDTSTGQPAAGMAIQCFRLLGEKRHLLCEVVTNADGRCDAPLLEGVNFQTGIYEICFDVGLYMKNANQDLTEPAFLGIVPIRFGISNATSHYHVPLLVSPWSYSTYRGS